jgi:hypothetical protein
MTLKDAKGGVVTWAAVAATLTTLLITIAGFSLAATRDDIKDLRDKKLDKAEYYQNLQQINGKLDILIKMRMEEGLK